MRTKSAGFSIMELMVYLVIAGTLMALIGPRIRDAYIASKKFKTEAIMTDIQQALQTFDMHVNRYPTTREGLDALISAPPNATGWQGPYLTGKEEPPKDSWGREFEYFSPPVENKRFRTYELISRGPTEDDPKNDIIKGQ